VVQAELARERLEEAARVALEVQARAKKMQLMALLPLLVIPVAGAENGVFLGGFPMFVPSLSWQNDRFYI
jgi:hypothetical protein